MSKKANVGQHLFHMTKPHSRPQNLTHPSNKIKAQPIMGIMPADRTGCVHAVSAWLHHLNHFFKCHKQSSDLPNLQSKVTIIRDFNMNLKKA